jgi:hypothetical protein
MDIPDGKPAAFHITRKIDRHSDAEIANVHVATMFDFVHYHLLARGSLDVVIESDLNILLPFKTIEDIAVSAYSLRGIALSGFEARYRSKVMDRKNVCNSRATSSGSSHSRKCPPTSVSTQRSTLKNRSPHSRGAEGNRSLFDMSIPTGRSIRPVARGSREKSKYMRTEEGAVPVTQ